MPIPSVVNKKEQVDTKFCAVSLVWAKDARFNLNKISIFIENLTSFSKYQMIKLNYAITSNGNESEANVHIKSCEVAESDAVGREGAWKRGFIRTDAPICKTWLVAKDKVDSFLSQYTSEPCSIGKLDISRDHQGVQFYIARNLVASETDRGNLETEVNWMRRVLLVDLAVAETKFPVTFEDLKSMESVTQHVGHGSAVKAKAHAAEKTQMCDTACKGPSCSVM